MTTFPTTFVHQTTGAKFTATGGGPFGASVSGTWGTGQEGAIFPAETFRDGSPCWVPVA